MTHSEAKQFLTDGGYAGIKTGQFETTRAMVDRGYRNFAKRYGWDKPKFNKCANREETNIDEYNENRGHNED